MSTVAVVVKPDPHFRLRTVLYFPLEVNRRKFVGITHNMCDKRWRKILWMILKKEIREGHPSFREFLEHSEFYKIDPKTATNCRGCYEAFHELVTVVSKTVKKGG